MSDHGGATAVEIDKTSTAAEAGGFARDLWPRGLKKIAADLPERTVLRPSTTEEARAIVRQVAQTGGNLQVFGAASNVVGALSEPQGTVVSTASLAGVLQLDEVSQTVTVGAGALGQTVETWLNARGFTLGHYPQSLAISTVGGWVSTRASGTYSAFHGGIERLICGATVVLADGEVLRVDPRVRPPGGLDFLQLLCGSEGSLGLITEVSLNVSRILAESRTCAAFASFRDGLSCQRELTQAGFAPALLRLYSAEETAEVATTGTVFEGECLMIMTTLGHELLVPSQSEAHAELIRQCGGRILPEDAGAGWYARRYRADGLMEAANATPGSMFDTIEISVPWVRAAECADELAQQLQPLCSTYYYHASHVYQGGVCLYLMLYVDAEDDDTAVEVVDKCWSLAMDTVERMGGAVGHHHGIGKVRQARYRASVEGQLHRRIKEALDPRGVFVSLSVEDPA